MSAFDKPIQPVFEMVLATDGSGSQIAPRPVEERSHGWDMHIEGQLAVDVIDLGKDILVASTMAGAVPDQIHVYIHNDLLTIRGERRPPVPAGAAKANYLHSECFWGTFSRTIVLPVDVKGELSRAEYKHGVLTVRIPKRQTDKVIPVHIIDE